jgi:hypothetical protein
MPVVVILSYSFSFSNPPDKRPNVYMEPELLEQLIRDLKYINKVNVCIYSRIISSKLIERLENDFKTILPESKTMGTFVSNIKKSVFNWKSSWEVAHFSDCMFVIFRVFLGK